MTEVRADTGTEPVGDAVAGGPSASGPNKKDQLLAARAARVKARGSKPTRTVSARVSVWRRMGEIWGCRELFVFLVRKEIKVRYKNSVLGFLWSMLNPALNLAVYFVIFTFFLRNGIPSFVIYMWAALLVWNLFSTSILTGTTAVVNNAAIVKKVAFPREVLVLASVGAASMFFFFQSIVMVLFLVVFRHAPAWRELWLLLPALAAIVAFSAALSIFLSAVNVYLRDTQHLVEVLLTAWFWAAPGIYAFSGRIQQGLAFHRLFGIPGTHLIWLYFANPVAPVVMTFQRVFYNNFHPISTVTHTPVLHGVLANYPTHWYVDSDLVVFGVSMVLLLGALVVFGHLEGNFAEEL